MLKLVTAGLASMVFTIFVVGEALAQAPTLIGQDKDWAVFSATVDGGDTCFVVSQPKNMEPKNVSRDPVYFFITQRPKDNVRNQVSVVTGYPYKDGSKTVVEIGSETFTLFTKDDRAWIENVEEQAKLVAAMKRGSTMTVRGTSGRGTNTIDTYSLSGITAAITRLAQACP
ncbi:MAG: invasion associated locus B family protein [Fimbriimonadaceae bacterium]|nr:invasion associated locus B family protein [Alphaproteobacteria bacterium]